MDGSYSWRFFKTPVWHVDAARGPSTPSLDHLVGEGEQLIRHIEPERFGGCKVDDEIEFGRQLDRHVGRLRSFENPAGVVTGTAIGIGDTRSVAHQDAGLGETA